MEFGNFIISAMCFLQLSIAFPENLVPISTYKDVPVRVFGEEETTSEQKLQFVQIMKPMVIKGIKRIAIASREKLYFLEPSQFSNPNNLANITQAESLTWKSTHETKELCLLKGQSKELCHNYLSIVETSSNENLLLCGTNSYDPTCENYKISITGDKLSFTRKGPSMSGKQRSPYGPDQQSASLFTGGSLYSATFQSFFGGTPLISRSWGESPSLRTSTTSRLMKEPKFVKMSEDDRRVLIYFNEVQELDGGEKRTVAQVAQVCKNDLGGARVLTRMFTTFVKSRLNCSYHGFYLDEVRDVTDPVTVNGQSMVYATFATSPSSLPGSAVCAFNLDTMRSSFSGSFVNSRKTTGTPPVSSRHPGKCPETRPLDDELVFIKTHPQMEKQVTGSLLATHYGQRWAAVAIDAHAGPNNVAVIFVGTEHGHLIRFLPPARSETKGTILSDQDVFDEMRCSSQHSQDDDRKVIKIVLEGKFVLVAFKHCVVAVPLSSCEVHGCKDACLASADPYCGWDGKACVAFNHPDQDLEQNLALSMTGSHKPCPVVADDVDINVDVEVEDDMNSTERIPTPPKSRPIEQDDTRSEVASKQSSGDLYPISTLFCVGGVTFTVTTILIFIIIILYNCCCQRSHEEDDLQKKIEEAHPLNSDEKWGSLSQRASVTFCGWKNWLHKVASPKTTPQPKRKLQPNQSRRENNYTEQPTLKQKDIDEAKKRRSTSSRINSVSSSTSRQSRQDTIGHISPTQSLVTSTSGTYDPASYLELTLPKHIADAPTLRLTAKPTSDSPLSSDLSDSSPFYPESGAGAAETGVLPTASAKLRRRNERAANQTNEIMRESDTAIKDLESTLLHMEEHGLMVVQHPVQNQLIRQRLDSNDSGKGESPRNSLRTDLEQPVSVITSRLQRPSSLNIQRDPISRRHRLLSEGSHPRDAAMQVMVFPRSRGEWCASGSHSSHSQPTTPDGGYEKLSLYQPIHHSHAEVYGTLPKTDCVNNMERIQQLKKTPEHFFQQPSKSNHLQHQVSIPSQQQIMLYGPVKFQRHSISEPKQLIVGSYSCSSPVKSHPNFYPSLQVRGVHAQKMPSLPQQQHQQYANDSPPRNPFTSLPRPNSTSHQIDRHHSFTPASRCEQPSLTHRCDKAPKLTRHTSIPGSLRRDVQVRGTEVA